MTDSLPYLVSLFIGIGLAAATGFRVFLPIFFLSLGTYLKIIPLDADYAWIGSLPAVIATGIATLTEIIAYYIPFVDNILDSITVPLATVAGSMLFASQFTEVNNWIQWSLAIIAGGGTAATISSVLAGTRAASSTTTAGIGNPVISTVETIGSTIMSVFAIFIPVLAGILVLIMLYSAIKYGKKLYYKISGKKQQNKFKDSTY
jgi:Kef-type K+ transport system membrane component KefB